MTERDRSNMQSRARMRPRSVFGPTFQILLTTLLLVPGNSLAIVVEELVLGPDATVELTQPIGEEATFRSLDLELGKSVFIRTDFNMNRVSVGDPTIADVVILGGTGVQIVPKKIGETNLIVWRNSSTPIAVIDVAVGTSYATLERRLRSVLKIDTIGVESVGNAIVLTGNVPSPVLAERALTIANAYFPEETDETKQRTVVSSIEVGGNQQVMIEVVIAEMSRSLGRRFNVNWDGMFRTAGNTFTATNLLGSVIGLGDGGPNDGLLVRSGVDFIGSFTDNNNVSLSYYVEAAIDNNLAKVLAKPTLMARSGQAASFLVGGEVPIPVAQEFGSISVAFKSFGIAVEFTPTVLGPDRIHLEIAPEVSEPDFTLATRVGGFATPGFVTRRASTSVELGDGQSFAIAGLLLDETSEFIEKFPMLGDIPILGALFRSTDYRRKETEMVMIVTPRLVKPLPDGPPTLPTDHFVDPNAFEFFLLGALESQHKEKSDTHGSAGLIGPAGHRVPTEVERIE